MDEVKISKVAAVLAEWIHSVQGQTASLILMGIASKRSTSSWLSECFGGSLRRKKQSAIF